MSWLGPVLFYGASLLAIAGALGTVLSRSAIRSAMSLLGAILGIAALFLALSAQLLAAVQLIVYAGAVVVLFVFVIMLIGPDGTIVAADRGTLRTRIAAVTLFAVSAITAIALTVRAGAIAAVEGSDAARRFRLATPMSEPAPVATFPHELQPPRQELGSVAALGKTLFSDGVVALELSGVLLLVAIVGVMGVASSGRRDRQSPDSAGKPQPREQEAS
jgi:NADH-quinone oxidoreductase subunit J